MPDINIDTDLVEENDHDSSTSSIIDDTVSHTSKGSYLKSTHSRRTSNASHMYSSKGVPPALQSPRVLRINNDLEDFMDNKESKKNL